MAYGLVVRGKLIRVCKNLKAVLESRAYEPWTKSCEVYEFKYNRLGIPVEARKI